MLEVRLSAHQGTVNLDTVKEPVTNFLVFGYDLIKGTSSDGSTKGDNNYPAPTLRVEPGERLIVHYDNDLQGLNIQDFYDPAFTPTGGEVPIYPPMLTEAPLNLHTHGLHVSPQGNADNVLLSIPAGMGNTYTYDVPKTMPNGLYWYHSHRHTMTAMQTYMGLAGLLEIGRPDGNLPLVTKNNIPVRDMAIQYNFVFDRNGKRPSAQQLQLAAVREHTETARGFTAGRRNLSAEPGPGEHRRHRRRCPIPHALVGRSAVATQQPRPDAVHPAESHVLRQPGEEGRRESGAAGEPARRAVHRQRPVPAGAEDQTRSD